MKTTIFAALALTFLATSARAEWWIDDAPVPIDGTSVQHCMSLEVATPRECSIVVRTDFETVNVLGQEYAAVAGFEVEGTSAIGICTVAPNQVGDTCLAFNEVNFLAEGTYRMCLTLEGFPADLLGGNWDDFGHGPQPEGPGDIESDLHHTSVMTQDCGILTAIQEVQ